MAPVGAPLTQAWGDGGRESSPRAPGSAAMGAHSRNSGTRENAGNTRGRAQGKKGGAHMRKQGRGIESDHPYPNTRTGEREEDRDRRIPIGRRGCNPKGERPRTREGGKAKREGLSLGSLKGGSPPDRNILQAKWSEPSSRTQSALNNLM